MAQELAFVLINPYTIAKSRTGGVIARLLARSDHDLVAVRMFAPSQKLVEEYSALLRVDSILDEKNLDDNKKNIRDLIADYVLANYAPDAITGRRRRVMMFLFKGEDAIRKLRDEVVGHITYTTVTGETIRDTYGDYIIEKDGHVKYFEPAVLVFPNSKNAEEKLKVWMNYSDQDGGILEDVISYPKEIKPQRTLVLIKPENFDRPTYRIGNIIDMFSKTGLYIVGANLIRMSVAQALEFYGPVKEILLKKMQSIVEDKVDSSLAHTFEYKIPSEDMKTMSAMLTPDYVEHEFNKIVQFMTGLSPADVTNPKEQKKPGRQRCLALVYEGVDAVNKIRAVLGLTDPKKAAPATVRREFGRNIMINAAHASDSTENAVREMDILNIGANDIKIIINEFITPLKQVERLS